MAFNYYICIVLIWQPFQVKAKARDATTFLSVTRESRRFRWPFLYFWFSSCFHFAPLLSHRIVSPFIYAQSCTINLQNKNNDFKLLGHCNNLCSLCGAHNSTGTQRGRQGEKGESWKKCKCSETLCDSFVSVCVSLLWHYCQCCMLCNCRDTT